MISNWSEFTQLFSIGLVLGFTVGFTCLAIRRIRLTMMNAFQRAMRI